MTPDVVIRGLAHQAGYSPDIDYFIQNAVPLATTLPLYPQLHQHTVIGEADITIEDNGDIVIEARVSKPAWLVGFPFLALAIDDPEDGFRRIMQASVTDSVINPLQLPYRITTFPESGMYDFMRNYESVTVIDEACDVLLQLTGDGAVQPVLEGVKTHIELRHRTERLRAELPNAVARGFGFASWDAIDGPVENPTGRITSVLTEVMGALRG